MDHELQLEQVQVRQEQDERNYEAGTKAQDGKVEMCQEGGMEGW